MDPQTQTPPQEAQHSVNPIPAAVAPQDIPLEQTQPTTPQPLAEPAAPVQLPTQPAPQATPLTPSKENIYTEICTQIIKEQSRIIGASLAVEQAASVEGLTVDTTTLHCDITGNGSMVINDLVEKYRDFFGHAAVEVCREAAARFLTNLPAEETPSSLKS